MPAAAADRLRRDEPTRDGETEVALLTHVRGVRTLTLARLHLERWTIEGLFHVLTTMLKCEQTSLGYPKAALFGFCVTLVAYHTLATVKAALRTCMAVPRWKRKSRRRWWQNTSAAILTG